MPFLPTVMAWDVYSVLTNAGTTLQKWGGALFFVIGVVMIIVAVVKFFMALVNHGKTQVSWAVIFIMFIVGGLLCVGGWNAVFDIAQGGKETIYDIGNGTASGGTTLSVIPFIGMF